VKSRDAGAAGGSDVPSEKPVSWRPRGKKETSENREAAVVEDVEI